ncbi:MAG: ferritin-like domain-containing protein [Acidimicrobiales bacterium]
MSTDHISEQALNQMTNDLDQLHHDQTQPAMNEAVDEWAELHREADAADARRPSRHSRRTFLLGTGAAVAGGVVLAACSSSTPTSSSSTTASSGGALSGDLQVAAMAASLENLAVGTYQAAIQAAQGGHLGTVPPAIANFAQTVMSQHSDHAKAWNAVLQQAGKQAVTGPDPVLKPTVDQGFAKVTDVTGVAQLALVLENTAAQTYQNGVGVLSNSGAIKTAATIQPVEMQHAAILYYVLGKYPGAQDANGTPLAFNPITLARPPSDYRGG